MSSSITYDQSRMFRHYELPEKERLATTNRLDWNDLVQVDKTWSLSFSIQKS